jgi:hypothetical protein
MSNHGFAVGDRIVIENHLGGNTSYSFGVVQRVTPATMVIRYHKNTGVTPSSCDGLSLHACITCTFDQPTSERVTLRWLSKQRAMGIAQPGSLMSFTARHFVPGETFNCVSYY